MNKEHTNPAPAASEAIQHTDTANQTLSGARAQSEGGAATTVDAHDDDFRTHWQTQYGHSSASRYEDLAPAYRFGHHRRNDQRYADHQWEEAEPEIRADWEQQDGSHPWEGVKDAIRYGWDKVIKSS